MTGYLQNLYDTTFVDWGVAGFQSTAYPDAFERYQGQIKDMIRLKGWPPDSENVLVSWAESIAKNADDAQVFWAQVAQGEPGKLSGAGINPATLPNYEKHRNWLSTVTDAAGSYQDVLDEYSPLNVVKGTISDTVDDLDPRKSWYPWAIGGGVLVVAYLVLRK